MKKLYAILVLCATLGCSHFKTAAINGHLNIIGVKREVKYEKSVWDFVVRRYGEEARSARQPMTHSDKLDFVQLAYETMEQARRDRIADKTGVTFPPLKKVVGFYNPTSNLVLYVTGEFGTLAHEYCHALNYQLNINLTPQQDEYFCQKIEEDYDGIQEVERLKHENKRLKRELNARRYR